MKLEELIYRRYGHWSSSMRHEMEKALKAAEKEIEAKHFASAYRTAQKQAQEASCELL
jgi:hypothetical protein